MFFSAKLFKQSPKSQLGLKITSQISSQVEVLVSWSTSLDCQSMFSVFNSRKSFFVSKKIVHCKNFEQNNRQKVINLRRRLSRSLACVPCSDFDGDALFFSPQRLSAPQRAVRNFAPPTFARSPRARSRPIGCSAGPLGVARLRALRKNELTGGGKYVVDTM